MQYIRKCRDCGAKVYTIEALEGTFVRSDESKYGFRNLCLPCLYVRRDKKYPSELQRDWKTKHQIKKRYGITPEEYKERMATSSECEVCGKGSGLCYDHDHDTMEFRGVLCRSCNKAIGALGDNIEGLQRALNYLTGEINATLY